MGFLPLPGGWFPRACFRGLQPLYFFKEMGDDTTPSKPMMEICRMMQELLFLPPHAVQDNWLPGCFEICSFVSVNLHLALRKMQYTPVTLPRMKHSLSFSLSRFDSGLARRGSHLIRWRPCFYSVELGGSIATAAAGGERETR